MHQLPSKQYTGILVVYSAYMGRVITLDQRYDSIVDVSPALKQLWAATAHSPI